MRRHDQDQHKGWHCRRLPSTLIGKRRNHIVCSEMSPVHWPLVALALQGGPTPAAVCFCLLPEAAQRLAQPAAYRNLACHTVLCVRFGQPTPTPWPSYATFSNTLSPPDPVHHAIDHLSDGPSHSVSSTLIASHITSSPFGKPKTLNRSIHHPAQQSSCTVAYPSLRWLPARTLHPRVPISESVPSLRFSILVSSPAPP
jgi:hypothetical protein